jgi:molybdopterin converting factor small subunit
MSVTVIFTGPIKIATGVVKTESEARNIEDLIEEMSRTYGAKFREEVKKTKILVNGYAIQFYDGLETALKSGDTVDFLQNWRIMDKKKAEGAGSD